MSGIFLATKIKNTQQEQELIEQQQQDSGKPQEEIRPFTVSMT